MFLTSALAIVPLAGLMGDATEALARFLGPTVGGLLNATLGNAPGDHHLFALPSTRAWSTS